MKMILFLAAVYSLIINQCYQKKTVAKSFPPRYMATIAKIKDSSVPKSFINPVTTAYIVPSSDPDYLPRFSVLR